MEYNDDLQAIKSNVQELLVEGTSEQRLHAAEILLDVRKEEAALSFGVADSFSTWQSMSLAGLSYFFVRCAVASIPAFLLLGGVYLASVILLAVVSQLLG